MLKQYLFLVTTIVLGVKGIRYIVKDDGVVIRGFFGSPLQLAYINITQEIPFSIIAQEKNKLMLSTTISCSQTSEKPALPLLHGEFEMFQCNDSLTFENSFVKEKNFWFYLNSKTSLNVISLARAFPKNEFSFIHYLYSNGLINQQSFYFKSGKLPQKNRGNLFFGKLREDSETYIDKSCHANLDKHTWECSLKGIEFEDEKMETKRFYTKARGIVFLFEKEKIYFPRDIMEYIRNEFLSSLIDKGFCHYIPQKNGYFNCSKKVETIFSESYVIRFYLNGFTWNFYLNKLFDCSTGWCVSLFVGEDNDDIIFGRNVLINEDDILGFKYDDMTVHFLTQDKSLVNDNQYKNFKTLGAFLVCNIFIIMCGIFAILVIKMKYTNVFYFKI